MDESSFIGKEPCPECGSRDNLARYSDGHAYCFGCGHYEYGDDENPTTKRSTYVASGLITDGGIVALSKRGISEETAKKFGYRVATYNGQKVQIAPYYDAEGNLVAQKVRWANKDMKIFGDFKNVLLFGQQLWGEGGRKVVITEGEIDAMTVSQMQGNKWPVVSIQNGAPGAAKSIKKQLEWLSSFEEVILMFDMDEAGQKAAVECAELFAPGKAKIAHLPEKDPNDCLTKGKGQEIINAVWNSKTYRPDGIVDGMSLWEVVVSEDQTASVTYPWVALNVTTHGLRCGELVTLTAGSGIGKSAVVREIAHHLIKMGERIGMIMLEESTKRTALGLMVIELNRPIHLSKEGVSEQQLREAFDATLGSGRVFLYDHFGSTEVENLLSRVRYMARALDCRWVVLDHLSIVVSGLDDGGDERKLIDRTMTMLRTLVQETGIGLILVSHLKRPDKKGHEEGAQTSLSQLRGSHAIAQLSDMVLGLERNQQGDNPNVTTVRVLKNRFSGETGVACHLAYDKHTGRLAECEPDFKDETQDVDGEF
jgi:twinkle protein